MLSLFHFLQMLFCSTFQMSSPTVAYKPFHLVLKSCLSPFTHYEGYQVVSVYVSWKLSHPLPLNLCSCNSLQLVPCLSTHDCPLTVLDKVVRVSIQENISSATLNVVHSVPWTILCLLDHQMLLDHLLLFELLFWADT